MTYPVMHRPSIEDTLEYHAECGAAEVEPGQSYEDWPDGSPDLMGDVLETAAQPPRYQPPAAPLPVITQNDRGLLVRTDFSDDRTVLVVPLADHVGWSFRPPPDQVRSMAANLFLGNNDIADWTHRGLPDGSAVMTEKERRSWPGW